MSATARINTWDEIWAEFDAREAARAAQETSSSSAGQTPAPEPTRAATRALAQPRRTGLPQDPAAVGANGAGRWHSTQPRRQDKPRRTRRLPRIIVLLACTLVAVYAGSPVASAVQVAAAIQRGDTAALAQHVDWTTLRPALDVALAAETQRNASQPMPDFILGMARDMAERLASPAGLALLLDGRSAGGVQPARDLLSRMRMLEAGLWEVTLASGHVPDRSARLTLALSDAMRLRWDVQAIEFSSSSPARLR